MGTTSAPFIQESYAINEQFNKCDIVVPDDFEHAIFRTINKTYHSYVVSTICPRLITIHYPQSPFGQAFDVDCDFLIAGNFILADPSWLKYRTIRAGKNCVANGTLSRRAVRADIMRKYGQLAMNACWAIRECC